MANTKSAQKAMRVSERRRLRSKPIRSSLKTFVKSAESVIAKPSEGEPLESVTRAIVELDKAASKGVIHRNTAARRKSRLMKKLNQSQAASA